MVAMDVRRPEGLVWVLVLVGSAPASSRRLSGRGASVTWDDPHARTRAWLVPTLWNITKHIAMAKWRG